MQTRTSGFHPSVVLLAIGIKRKLHASMLFVLCPWLCICTQKVPCTVQTVQGTFSRGSTHVIFLVKEIAIYNCRLYLFHIFRKITHFDGNGITGPDWGHSEVVFGCFLSGCFQHIYLPDVYQEQQDKRHPSLRYSPAYSSRQRVIFFV